MKNTINIIIPRYVSIFLVVIDLVIRNLVVIATIRKRVKKKRRNTIFLVLLVIVGT